MKLFLEIKMKLWSVILKQITTNVVKNKKTAEKIKSCAAKEAYLSCQVRWVTSSSQGFVLGGLILNLTDAYH